MPDILPLLKSRCSVRSFKSTSVEEEKINQILEAAKVAPTACNKQPQFIYVIKSKEGLETLQKCKPQHFNEQLAFLICYNKDTCWIREYDSKSSGEVDATIVATHMMLEAESLGLSSTWIMHFDPKAIRYEFNIPNNIIPVALLVMGYKDISYKPSPTHLSKKDIKEFTKEI